MLTDEGSPHEDHFLKYLLTFRMTIIIIMCLFTFICEMSFSNGCL